MLHDLEVPIADRLAELLPPRLAGGDLAAGRRRERQAPPAAVGALQRDRQSLPGVKVVPDVLLLVEEHRQRALGDHVRVRAAQNLAVEDDFRQARVAADAPREHQAEPRRLDRFGEHVRVYRRVGPQRLDRHPELLGRVPVVDRCVAEPALRVGRVLDERHARDLHLRAVGVDEDVVQRRGLGERAHHVPGNPRLGWGVGLAVVEHGDLLAGRVGQRCLALRRDQADHGRGLGEQVRREVGRLLGSVAPARNAVVGAPSSARILPRMSDAAGVRRVCHCGA